MGSSITAIGLVLVLSAWHLRNRRHPGWRGSADGRFYIYLGYPFAVIGVYWLVHAPTATAWEWAFGNAWVLAAMVLFVCGFEALNRVTASRRSAAQAMESTRPNDIPIDRR